MLKKSTKLHLTNSTEYDRLIPDSAQDSRQAAEISEISGLKNKDLSTLFPYISRLCSKGFYGKLVISFEAGRIVHLKEERSLKLETIRGEIN
jgi:hypothetical protein